MIASLQSGRPRKSKNVMIYRAISVGSSTGVLEASTAPCIRQFPSKPVKLAHIHHNVRFGLNVAAMHSNIPRMNFLV